MQVLSPLSPIHRTSFPSIASFIPAPHPTANVTLPHLCACGFVNRELGDLKGQRGARVPKTGDGEPLPVDAMVRFFNEFIIDGQVAFDATAVPAGRRRNIDGRRGEERR